MAPLNKRRKKANVLDCREWKILISRVHKSRPIFLHANGAQVTLRIQTTCGTKILFLCPPFRPFLICGKERVGNKAAFIKIHKELRWRPRESQDFLTREHDGFGPCMIAALSSPFLLTPFSPMPPLLLPGRKKTMRCSSLLFSLAASSAAWVPSLAFVLPAGRTSTPLTTPARPSTTTRIYAGQVNLSFSPPLL